MSSACRSNLAELKPQPDSHAGLLLDRYLKNHKEEVENRDKKAPTPEVQLLKAIVDVAASEPYKTAFSRRQDLQLPNGSCLQVTATLASPLAIGLGNESPLEVGLTIHHTYGMPVIPGSAIKGLLRRAALRLRAENKLTDDQFNALFGTQNAASYFTYFDAWYDPDSEGNPFHRDVVTVHHPKYYSSRGKDKDGKDVWPTDFDDPTPIPFLVVPPGARFLFAIQCPDSGWHDFMRNMLDWALRELGIGAKTNAGYGRFELEAETDAVSSLGRPTAASVFATETWVNAHVIYRPGSQEIIAKHASGGRSARVQGKAAKELLDGLPAEVQAGLKKGRAATVEAAQVGNAFTIVRIESA